MDLTLDKLGVAPLSLCSILGHLKLSFLLLFGLPLPNCSLVIVHLQFNQLFFHLFDLLRLQVPVHLLLHMGDPERSRLLFDLQFALPLLDVLVEPHIRLTPPPICLLRCFDYRRIIRDTPIHILAYFIQRLLPISLNFIQVVPVVVSMLDLILLTLLFRKDFGGYDGLSFVLDGFSLPELVFFSFLFLG